MKKTILTLTAGLLLSGCSLNSTENHTKGGAQSLEEFTYSNFRDEDLNLRTLDASGEPVAGVSITIRGASSGRYSEEGYVEGAVLYRGRTDRSGSLANPLSFPADVQNLEVIANRKGYVGMYDDEEMHERMGFFAPSSMRSALPSDLAGMTIELNPREAN